MICSVIFGEYYLHGGDQLSFGAGAFLVNVVTTRIVVRGQRLFKATAAVDDMRNRLLHHAKETKTHLKSQRRLGLPFGYHSPNATGHGTHCVTQSAAGTRILTYPYSMSACIHLYRLVSRIVARHVTLAAVDTRVLFFCKIV